MRLQLFIPEKYQHEQQLLSVCMIPTSIGRTEITFEWAGESIESNIPSFLYAGYRLLCYGRVKDLETIYITSTHTVDMNGTLNHPDVTSWYDTTYGHYTTSYDTVSKDIRLYVNTWNHLMSPVPLADLTYVELTGFKWKTESRAALERHVSIQWPWKRTVSVSGTVAPYIDPVLLLPVVR
jgi:hypothetical protein